MRIRVAATAVLIDVAECDDMRFAYRPVGSYRISNLVEVEALEIVGEPSVEPLVSLTTQSVGASATHGLPWRRRHLPRCGRSVRRYRSSRACLQTDNCKPPGIVRAARC